MLDVLVYSNHRIFVCLQFAVAIVNFEIIADVHHERRFSGKALVGPKVRASLRSNDFLLFHAEVSRVNVDAHSIVRFSSKAFFFITRLLG